MRFQVYLLLLLSFVSFTVKAQEHQERYQAINIIHYRFQLVLNDQNDLVKGQAKVDVQFLKPVSGFTLDLVGKENGSDTGMEVRSVGFGPKEMPFNHVDHQLNIQLITTPTAGEIRSFLIDYEGIPADGLIIAKNRHGDRTFFGDNWPNRARHWLPTVDHPSDKATVEFVVTAPDHYQVIANGVQIEETNISDDLKLTHWKEEVPLPTKVMVIGVARFAVNLAGYVDDIPVTSWVYRQDRDNGFEDYKIAVDVLDFFYQKMGSYPYEKLANVQSKTRYGGMENAGNIFYFEKSVNGKQDQEKLIAHEIAHQWFGNSASELNWHHIWLSEGFATYLTDLYLEEVRGEEAFINNLEKERQRVIQFSKKKKVPIVDTSVKDYNQLLNANSYQKGAWVLHMLRREVGDVHFWNGIKAYYQKYQFSNALSADFQKVMEDVSDKKLDNFFKQWLYELGHPKLKVEWKKTARKRGHITIRQIQKGNLFDFPLDLAIYEKGGNVIRKTIRMNDQVEKVKIKTERKIDKVVLDPDCRLLFEKG